MLRVGHIYHSGVIWKFPTILPSNWNIVEISNCFFRIHSVKYLQPHPARCCSGCGLRWVGQSGADRFVHYANRAPKPGTFDLKSSHHLHKPGITPYMPLLSPQGPDGGYRPIIHPWWVLFLPRPRWVWKHSGLWWNHRYSWWLYCRSHLWY